MVYGHDAHRKHDENVQFVHQSCRDLVEERRANPPSKNDIFSALVDRRDPAIGEELSLDIIVVNMITFLFAGHDRASGLLSFLVYLLIKNPDAYAKIQEEVDRVPSKRGGLTVEHLDRLECTWAYLPETFLLEPPSPELVLAPFIDESEHFTIGGGGCVVRSGQTTVIVFS